LNKNIQVSDKFCEEFDHKLCHYNIWRINGKPHKTLGGKIFLVLKYYQKILFENFNLIKKIMYLYNTYIINGKPHRTLGPAINDEFWYRGEKIEVSNILNINIG
jgi:hypothetical protein